MVSAKPDGSGLRVAFSLQSTGIDLAGNSGPPILIRAHMRQLARAGHHVAFYSLRERRAIRIADADRPETEEELTPGFTGSQPFKILESGLRRAQSSLGLPYFGLFESARFREACGRFLDGYDVCHEYHRLFSLGAAVACRRLGVPYVLTVDADEMLESELAGRPLKGLQARYASWSARYAFDSAAGIVCVSEPTRRRLIERWGVDEGKIAVVPNGVDLDRFKVTAEPAAARSDLGLEERPTVLFLGGFQPWHGLAALVESFGRVLDRCPEARLVLVGDGPLRAEIEGVISRARLEQAVTLTGSVHHSEAPRWLAAADVVVAPYPELPEEMWFSPLKLFEYMAAGRAIVASRAGQMAEVIEDGRTGLLTRPGDSADLAQAIVALLSDEPRRRALGAAARLQAERRHGWDRAGERLVVVYREAIGRNEGVRSEGVRG